MSMKITKYLLICILAGLLLLILNTLVNPKEINVRKYPTAGPSEVALSNAISRYKNGEISVVDLSTVTTFSWDRLYIFGPYTGRSKIDAVIGKPWRDTCFTTIDSYDGFTLLVFTSNHQVVGCIEYPRDVGDFSPLESHESGFSAEEARFVLDERANVIWIGNK
jgi:hypothetical protein